MRSQKASAGSVYVDGSPWSTTHLQEARVEAPASGGSLSCRIGTLRMAYPRELCFGGRSHDQPVA